MTFDKVNTMNYQPRISDNYRGQRPRWLSLLRLINIVLTDIKSQQLFYQMTWAVCSVHKNIPSNQNIRIKANVIRIFPIYIWAHDSYNTLIGQKGRCMALTHQERKCLVI